VPAVQKPSLENRVLEHDKNVMTKLLTANSPVR
jgi:hypothetical protein